MPIRLGLSPTMQLSAWDLAAFVACHGLGTHCLLLATTWGPAAWSLGPLPTAALWCSPPSHPAYRRETSAYKPCGIAVFIFFGYGKNPHSAGVPPASLFPQNVPAATTAANKIGQIHEVAAFNSRLLAPAVASGVAAQLQGTSHL